MTLRNIAKAVVPRAVYPSALLRRMAQRATRNTVMSGPFAGMRYLDASISGAYIPKLIGCYELEVHPFVERLISLRPSHVINIGGGEGYYSVGLLLRLPDSRVTVFEQLDSGRAAIHELARLNFVSRRLLVRGNCDPVALARCLCQTPAEALVADVEGYEVQLLDPERVPALERLHILVEVHDSIAPGCTDQIIKRFSKTHLIERVAQRPRVISDYPLRDLASRIFPSMVLRYALNEFRSPQTAWLQLSPF